MKWFSSYSGPTRLHYLLLMACVASGCASPPIKPTQPPSLLSVAQIRAALTENETPQITVENKVLWGGVILKAENLADTTQVEILGYPLDRRQRPLSSKTAEGRFIAQYDGFIEPLDFPIGDSLTVLGSLVEPITGKVGEANYIYPVVSADQSHLWQLQDLPRPPRVSFGLGLIFGN